MNPWSRLMRGWSPALSAITFVVIAYTAGSLAAEAQTAERVYKLGFLGQTSGADLGRQTTALRQGLRDGEGAGIDDLTRVPARAEHVIE